LVLGEGGQRVALRPGRRRAIEGAGPVPPLGKEVSTGNGDCASTEIKGEEVPLGLKGETGIPLLPVLR